MQKLRFIYYKEMNLTTSTIIIAKVQHHDRIDNSQQEEKKGMLASLLWCCFLSNREADEYVWPHTFISPF